MPGEDLQVALSSRKRKTRSVSLFSGSQRATPCFVTQQREELKSFVVFFLKLSVSPSSVASMKMHSLLFFSFKLIIGNTKEN